MNPKLINIVWGIARDIMTIWGHFVPVQKKTIIFCAFGGRKFDDSPRAIYEEVCRREYFDDWKLIWAFVDPAKHEIPRGEKIKVDSYSFFKALLYSRVWVSNSGMDRGIELKRDCNLRVETWHGTPLKKICGEEHQNSLSGKMKVNYQKEDSDTIRCAQSNYDREIFARIFNSDRNAILLCDLPRNDKLLKYTKEEISDIKRKIGVDLSKKIILYAPTYREYLVDDDMNTYIAPPINLSKWEEMLDDEFVLLIRAHYAVTSALGIKNTDFVKDVSSYPYINDLYVISDLLISDYSSSFVDYSILDRPMLCFAYDIEEYEEKRGLYVKLEKELPCKIDYNEDALINHILSLDVKSASEKTRAFHKKYAPYAGNASSRIVDEIVSRLRSL